MRLMQLSEYLAVLSAGTLPAVPSEQLATAALDAAFAVWDETGLEQWHAQPRRMLASYSTMDGEAMLCQVNAGPLGCVLIVMLHAPSLVPSAYLVVDLGAEHATPILRCPSLPYAGPATKRALAAGIPQLGEDETAFLQIETGPGTYLQATRQAEGNYRLEHQLVTPSNRYRAAEALDPETAVRTMHSYAFGQYEWASNIRWRRASA